MPVPLAAASASPQSAEQRAQPSLNVHLGWTARLGLAGGGRSHRMDRAYTRPAGEFMILDAPGSRRERRGGTSLLAPRPHPPTRPMCPRRFHKVGCFVSSWLSSTLLNRSTRSPILGSHPRLPRSRPAHATLTGDQARCGKSVETASVASGRWCGYRATPVSPHMPLMHVISLCRVGALSSTQLFFLGSSADSFVGRYCGVPTSVVWSVSVFRLGRFPPTLSCRQACLGGW